MSKILIVEDEENLAEMYRIKFVAEGFEVFMASNGQEGFDIAKKVKPDLVFLDLVMPVMDGFEALDLIRKNKATKDLLVVILSNLGQQEEIDDGIKRGANAFLIKANLTPRELVAKTREMLSMQSEQIKREASIRNGEKLPENEAHNGLTVLFIEDNKEIIQMYRMQFQKSGYNVELADNGAWGVKLAKEKKFDAILMDIMMPAMNGHQMLRSIKEESKNIDTPVIVISNSAQDEDIESAIALGADRYFVKSNITPKKLVDELAKLMKK